MNLLITVAPLVLLMLAAYRGYSVIIMAPLAALLAVLLTDPGAVAPIYSGVFMERMVGFLKLYFPVFLLGALFGKVVELAGFSKAIVDAVIRLVGGRRAILAIVVVCALLTYGGVSLFVVVFAVYPFAAEMFRQGAIPKRLIPATIALGAFTFTMDSLPGTPQIQNIIPTTFFMTDAWAAPWLGTIGAAFILIAGLSYLEWQRRRAALAGEDYGTGHSNEPDSLATEALANPGIAITPLVVVALLNLFFTHWIPRVYGASSETIFGVMAQPVKTQIASVTAIWAVEAALLGGIACVLIFAGRRVMRRFAEGSRVAVSGALLASLNTASEYGFGAVIAVLPGFAVVQQGLRAIPDPLINEAVAVTTLAGITGSASGGMSIALAAMSDSFIAAANGAGIPLEVMHRVAAMASGGMDSLPHNGAVITLLTVVGLTHRQAYKDIFAITCIKTIAVFFVIAVYYLTHLV
ncbi:MAG: GntP family permease [Pseudomonadota bacterium]